MSKILVIDDSMLSRAMITTPLQRAGHEVIQANDGQQGLDAYHEHLPDCVTTDLLMPVLDGISFLEKIRGEGVKVPIIVVSADIQSSSKEICEQHGIEGFLNKPVDTNVLLELVQAALEKSEEVHI